MRKLIKKEINIMELDYENLSLDGVRQKLNNEDLFQTTGIQQ